MERSAVPACAKAHPDDCQDDSVPAEEDLARHQSDAAQSAPSASDASDVARPDATADVERQHRRRPVDVDVGKLAGPVLDAQALDASPLED